MNVKNCRKCGKMYNYISGPNMCPDCREALEKKFQEVKEYVRENKGSTINMVAEACEVDAQQIKQWVREERLEFSSDSALVIECESCGSPIKIGRFCEKCKNSMANSFAEAAGLNKKPEAAKRPTREAARMRFLDNH